jgi:hypothetical protein
VNGGIRNEGKRRHDFSVHGFGKIFSRPRLSWKNNNNYLILL